MEITFNIDKDKTPYHANPYRIPVAHMTLIKKTISRMVDNKTLAAYNDESEWTSSTFGVPKNNDGVRIETEIRKPNETIKRKVWSMPTI